MSTSHALLVSLSICFVAAAFEGLCAGKGVRSYFAQLRFPRYSAPLWVWYGIGGVYYAVFFFIIFELLRIDKQSRLRTGTLALIIFMMVANALWNYLFFRAKKLFASFVSGSLAPITDLALFICLIKLDTTAAWALVPYLIYRIYAVWWGYGLWKMNRET
jgi:tryptophan-rich sensory protein